MPDMVSELRNEVVESEKARMDFLKWKVILIAGLAAAGLGVGYAQAFPVILAFIPFVCAYVDVVCIHNDLRIHVIASFLRSRRNTAGFEDAADYETRCRDNGGMFGLESFALIGTTIVMCVTIYGLPAGWIFLLPKQANAVELSRGVAMSMKGAAFLGAAVSAVALTFKRLQLSRLRKQESSLAKLS